MKKIMVILALAASIMTANAQKSQEVVTKAIAKAQADSENPKKNEKVATWLNLAKAHMDAYNAPQLNGWIGASATELNLVMSDTKPLKTLNETLGGTTYKVQVYPTCKYYFNNNGALEMIVTTKEYEENALGKALDAYAHAATVDPKGTKTKDIVDGIKLIAEKYRTEAVKAYTFGDYKTSSANFIKAVKASGTSPLGAVDTLCIYNAGFTAFLDKDWETAKQAFTQSIKIGYTQDGDAYAKLSTVYKNLGSNELAEKTLEEGLQACPTSQAILIGLINLYMENNTDPNKLFQILELAEKNEPNNAALYYVEGNTRKQLGQVKEAVEAYDKCLQINPEYEYGEIGKAQLYAAEGDKYGKQAQEELDDAKYNALLEKCAENYKLSLVAFEKAFNLTKSEDLKKSIAEYLKQLYFKFRNESPEYLAGYDKYNKFLQQ